MRFSITRWKSVPLSHSAAASKSWETAPDSQKCHNGTDWCSPLVAQLSRRHRGAGWVSFGQKWKTIFCRHYRSIFNHCDVIDLQATEFGEITQNKVYHAVQGHSRSPRSVVLIECPHVIFYWWLILTDILPFRSYRRLLFKFGRKTVTLRLQPPLGLMGNVHCSS